MVTKAANPLETTEAMRAILTRPEMRLAMDGAGRKRTARYYSEPYLNATCRGICRKAVASPVVACRLLQ